VLVEFETLDALLEVELVEVVEGHEVAISSEDVHLAVVDAHALPVPSARLLPNYVSVAVVVDDLLLYLLLARLLVPNRLERLHHRLSDRRKLSLLLLLPA
jgi:hypothetical protein